MKCVCKFKVNMIRHHHSFPQRKKAKTQFYLLGIESGHFISGVRPECEFAADFGVKSHES